MEAEALRATAAMASVSGESSHFRSPALRAGAVCGAGFGACHSLVFCAILVELLVPITLEAFPFQISAASEIERRMEAEVPNQSDRWSVSAEAHESPDHWSVPAEVMDKKGIDERRVQAESTYEYEYEAAPAEDGGARILIEFVTRVVVMIVLLVGNLVGFWLYWRCYIRDTAEKHIPQRAMVPPDMMGSWAFGTFDCFAEMGTCCCFLWCGPCAVSELWYRAGFIHGFMSENTQNPCSCCEPCPGWEYFVGALLFFAAEATNCLPCLGAFFRGGARWIDQGNGGMDSQDLRQRFGIQNDSSFGTFCNDCLLWCCCPVCVGVQEYRQVMKLLGRWPLNVAAPQSFTVAGTVVGAPVQVATCCLCHGHCAIKGGFEIDLAARECVGLLL